MSCWADGRGMQSGYVWGYMHCDEEVVLQALAKGHQSSINWRPQYFTLYTMLSTKLATF